MPYIHSITKYQVTSDKGTKRILFVYDGDDYDMSNPEQVKSNILTLDEVDRYFKD